MLLHSPSRFVVNVVSSGGAGTTMLIQFLEAHIRCNDPSDYDTLKHCSRPPLSLNRDLKIIYIVGDPCQAVGSLFRRNYQVSAYRKLARFSCKLNQRRHLRSLQTYIDSGEDILLFGQHFDNWVLRPNPYELLVVNYERMWDELDTILDFVGLPREMGASFPKKRSRKTSLSTEEEEQLQQIYGPLQQKIEEASGQHRPKPPAGTYLGYQLKTLPLFLVSNLFVELPFTIKTSVSRFMKNRLPGLHKWLKGVCGG